MAGTTKIKICGITNREDAQRLAGLEVDALGFIVTEKKFPFRISAKDAKEIVADLPPFITSVLAVAYLDLEELIFLCKEIKPDAVQIQYGLDRISELKELRKRLPWVQIIKTIHADLENPDKKEIFDKTKEFVSDVDAFLLDGLRKKYKKLRLQRYWRITRKVVEESSKPVILAGKLDAKNVGQAIKIVKPYAVDLISGVETIPGKKDFKKVNEFIKVVRGTLV